MTGDMTAVAFLLGSPNSCDGVLSDIALSRVDAACLLSELIDPLRLMVTGGFGAHFNTSNWPHRELVHRTLGAMNVPFDPLQSGDLESCNTIEDMLLIGELLNREHISNCFVITSTFHISRCRVLFGCLCPGRKAVFVAARDPENLSTDLLEHERSAMQEIGAAGGVRWNNSWYATPAES